MFVDSATRRACLPRTSGPKSERLYSTRSSSTVFRLAFLIDRRIQFLVLGRDEQLFVAGIVRDVEKGVLRGISLSDRSGSAA